MVGERIVGTSGLWWSVSSCWKFRKNDCWARELVIRTPTEKGVPSFTFLNALSAKFPESCFLPVILRLRYQMALVVESGRLEWACWGGRLATCSSFAMSLAMEPYYRRLGPVRAVVPLIIIIINFDKVGGKYQTVHSSNSEEMKNSGRLFVTLVRSKPLLICISC
jgi:hypothetical protein